MGFHAYSSPYDWSRIAGFKATATDEAMGCAGVGLWASWER